MRGLQEPQHMFALFNLPPTHAGHSGGIQHSLQLQRHYTYKDDSISLVWPVPHKQTTEVSLSLLTCMQWRCSHSRLLTTSVIAIFLPNYDVLSGQNLVDGRSLVLLTASSLSGSRGQYTVGGGGSTPGWTTRSLQMAYVSVCGFATLLKGTSTLL